MHQTKYQVDMNLNSYVGQLRQQIASKPAFSLPPARLRMFLGGTCTHFFLTLWFLRGVLLWSKWHTHQVPICMLEHVFIWVLTLLTSC